MFTMICYHLPVTLTHIYKLFDVPYNEYAYSALSYLTNSQCTRTEITSQNFSRLDLFILCQFKIFERVINYNTLFYISTM